MAALSDYTKRKLRIALGSTVAGDELGDLNGATPGTVTASKAVIVDSDKGAAGFGAVTITEDVTSALAITGTVTNGINFTGGTPTKILKAGSYSTMLTHQGTEMVTVAASGSGDGWYLGYGCYLRATGEDGKPFGFCATIESTNTTGTNKIQAGQFIAGLGSIGSGGTEAAVLKTRGGDATAGLYAVWAKIGANTNCTCASGSRCAAIWLDNQMNGTMSGEEYTIFSSTGGSVPDAWASFETTSSGWAKLFHFDDTMVGVAPLSSSKVDATENSEGTLLMDINGTTYYIPYYAAADLV